MKKRNTKIAYLSQLEKLLPKYSYAPSGKSMEPINLVVVGNKRFVAKHFKRHGWFRADKLGALTLSKALAATIFNRSYKTGPFLNISYLGQPYELGFQKPTKSDTYRRRHHLRLWRTPYKIGGRRIWAGAISYDRSIGLGQSHEPIHHISPKLSLDEEFLARSFGIARPRYLRVSPPMKGKLGTGDKYVYDGRALILDLSGLENL